MHQSGGRSAGVDDTDAFARQLHYLADLIGFNRIIAQNEADCKVTQDPSPKQLLYLLDTNVLQLCFEPRHEAGLTRPFRSVPVHCARDEAVAIITAEFLLSGELPGRRGAPLFVAPAHWAEFTRRFEGVRQRLLDAKARLAGDTDIRKAALANRVAALRERVEAAGRDVDALYRLYNDDVQKLYEDDEIDLFARPSRLSSLLRSGTLIRPLMEAPYIRPDLMRVVPEDADVEAWFEQLSEIHKRRGSDALRENNLRADAVTLALMERMNADLKAREVPVSLVLITSDRAVLDATFRGEDEARHDLARDIRQFIPLINRQDIRGNGDAVHLTKEIRLAIEAHLTETAGTSDEIDPDAFTRGLHAGVRSISQMIQSAFRHRRRGGRAVQQADALLHHVRGVAEARIGPMIGQPFEETLENVGDRWSELIENCRRTHADLIASYYGSFLGDIADAFDALGGARRGIARRHLQEAKDITRDLACLHLESALQKELAGSGPFVAVWRDLALGLTLAPAEGDSPVEGIARRILDAVVSAQWNEAHNQTKNLCGLPDEPVQRIAVSCASVALQLGLFRAAHTLSHYAIELAEAHRMENRAGQLALTEGRAHRLAAISGRLTATDDRPEPVVCRTPKLVDSCARAFKLLSAADRHVEAALARAEQATLDAAPWMTAATWSNPARGRDATIRALGGPTEALESLETIVIHAAEAIDLAARDSDGTVFDLLGRPAAPAAQAQAAAAILWAMLSARALDHPVPSLVDGYVDKATDILARHADPAQGGQRHALALVALAKGVPVSDVPPDNPAAPVPNLTASAATKPNIEDRLAGRLVGQQLRWHS